MRGSGPRGRHMAAWGEKEEVEARGLPLREVILGCSLREEETGPVRGGGANVS